MSPEKDPVPSLRSMTLLFTIKLSPYTDTFASMVMSPPKDDVSPTSRVLAICIAPVNEEEPPTSRVPAISVFPPNDPLPFVSNRMVSLLTLIFVVAWTFPSKPRRSVDCTSSLVKLLYPMILIVLLSSVCTGEMTSVSVRGAFNPKAVALITMER